MAGLNDPESVFDLAKTQHENWSKVLEKARGKSFISTLFMYVVGLLIILAAIYFYVILN